LGKAGECKKHYQQQKVNFLMHNFILKNEIKTSTGSRIFQGNGWNINRITREKFIK
jgi:hypothetical protein